MVSRRMACLTLTRRSGWPSLHRRPIWYLSPLKDRDFSNRSIILVSSGATSSSGVIPIASISQNFRSAASVGSSTFVKRTPVASAFGLEWGFPQIIQPSSVSRAMEPVAFLFIRPVTKS
ncbi:hypothetical protein T4D_10040 [Trichinella pseudospiralis]|uniref:Uncharacterized protein n=1 Tax=Trichinella pseudospiralis TaxID=6337 RepID=A0A0V1DRQ1_TRIPS|nr:hypothetical protein T4D_10040 [Trichinella pseudospiralis]